MILQLFKTQITLRCEKPLAIQAKADRQASDFPFGGATARGYQIWRTPKDFPQSFLLFHKNLNISDTSSITTLSCHAQKDNQVQRIVELLTTEQHARCFRRQSASTPMLARYYNRPSKAPQEGKFSVGSQLHPRAHADLPEALSR